MIAAQFSGRRAAALASVGLALLLGVAAVLLRGQQPAPTGLLGQRVQPLELPLVPLLPRPDVARVVIGDDAGRPALIHFWGPSCAPCIAEGPAIDALGRDGPAQGFTLHTVSAEEVTEIRALLLEKGWRFPVLHDVAMQAHAAFRVAQIPATFLLDGHGVVRQAWLGPQPAGALGDAARALAAAEAAQKE